MAVVAQMPDGVARTQAGMSTLRLFICKYWNGNKPSCTPERHYFKYNRSRALRANTSHPTSLYATRVIPLFLHHPILCALLSLYPIVNISWNNRSQMPTRVYPIVETKGSSLCVWSTPSCLIHNLCVPFWMYWLLGVPALGRSYWVIRKAIWINNWFSIFIPSSWEWKKKRFSR